MDSMAVPMANLGTNMFANPTVVQLHVKMHGFYGDNHIGELKCVQITSKNIPSELNVCKIRKKSQVTDLPARCRTAIEESSNIRKILKKKTRPATPASYRTAIQESSNVCKTRSDAERLRMSEGGS